MVLQNSPLNVCTELKHEGEICAMHPIPRYVCEEILRSDDSVDQLRKNPVILSFISLCGMYQSKPRVPTEKVSSPV